VTRLASPRRMQSPRPLMSRVSFSSMLSTPEHRPETRRPSVYKLTFMGSHGADPSSRADRPRESPAPSPSQTLRTLYPPAGTQLHRSVSSSVSFEGMSLATRAHLIGPVVV
jgi:hypothetical protein